MIKCDKCGFLADEKFNYCPSCGTALIKNESNNHQSLQNIQSNIEIIICDVCGENTTNENGFCENCGAKLTGREKVVEIKGVTEVIISAATNKIKKENIQEKKKGKLRDSKNK